MLRQIIFKGPLAIIIKMSNFLSAYYMPVTKQTAFCKFTLLQPSVEQQNHWWCKQLLLKVFFNFEIVLFWIFLK